MKEIVREGVNWIELAQDRIHLRAGDGAYFITSRTNVGWSARVLLNNAELT
jgi:hypothetical protein